MYVPLVMLILAVIAAPILYYFLVYQPKHQ